MQIVWRTLAAPACSVCRWLLKPSPHCEFHKINTANISRMQHWSSAWGPDNRWTEGTQDLQFKCVLKNWLLYALYLISLWLTPSPWQSVKIIFMVFNKNLWILLNSLSDFMNNFNLVLSCRETGGCHKKLQIHVLQLRSHRHLCEHLALYRELHQLQTPCTRKTDGGAVQVHQHGWPRWWRRRQGTGRDDEGENYKWRAVCATGNQHLATRWLALLSWQSHCTTTIKKRKTRPSGGRSLVVLRGLCSWSNGLPWN